MYECLQGLHGGSVAVAGNEQEHLPQAAQHDQQGDASYHGDGQGAKEAMLHGRNHRAECASVRVVSEKGLTTFAVSAVGFVAAEGSDLACPKARVLQTPRHTSNCDVMVPP
jgi:hypothetical protein